MNKEGEVVEIPEKKVWSIQAEEEGAKRLRLSPHDPKTQLAPYNPYYNTE